MTPNKRVQIKVIHGKEAMGIFRIAQKMTPTEFTKWPITSECCEAPIKPRVIRSSLMGMVTENIAPCCTKCQLLECGTSLDTMLEEVSANLVDISMNKLMSEEISTTKHDENVADISYFIGQMKILYNGVEA